MYTLWKLEYQISLCYWNDFSYSRLVNNPFIQMIWYYIYGSFHLLWFLNKVTASLSLLTFWLRSNEITSLSLFCGTLWLLEHFLLKVYFTGHSASLLWIWNAFSQPFLCRLYIFLNLTCISNRQHKSE